MGLALATQMYSSEAAGTQGPQTSISNHLKYKEISVVGSPLMACLYHHTLAILRCEPRSRNEEAADSTFCVRLTARTALCDDVPDAVRDSKGPGEAGRQNCHKAGDTRCEPLSLFAFHFVSTCLFLSLICLSLCSQLPLNIC